MQAVALAVLLMDAEVVAGVRAVYRTRLPPAAGAGAGAAAQLGSPGMDAAAGTAAGAAGAGHGATVRSVEQGAGVCRWDLGTRHYGPVLALTSITQSLLET